LSSSSLVYQRTFRLYSVCWAEIRRPGSTSRQPTLVGHGDIELGRPGSLPPASGKILIVSSARVDGQLTVDRECQVILQGRGDSMRILSCPTFSGQEISS
jgi:hypothetical protein